jgi:uncharacterized membrane protein YidH (DUF202 family)
MSDMEIKTPKKNVKNVSSDNSFKNKDNYNQKSQNEVKTNLPGFFFASVVVFISYIILFPLGFVLNIIFYNNAKRTVEEAGTAPRGFGCLQIMLYIAVILMIVLGFCLVMIVMYEVFSV